jgi:hypothetical protein
MIDEAQRESDTMKIVDTTALVTGGNRGLGRAAKGVSVHVAIAGPIDTDMSRDADIPKSSAETVARGILDGVEGAEADIFPDSVSGALAGSWRTLATDVLEMRRSWQKK